MSGGNSQEAASHCPLSPAVPRPHSCSPAPRSFVPWTGGWASAVVTPSLSGWAHVLLEAPGAWSPACSLLPLSGLLLTHWDPGREPEWRRHFPVFCLQPSRETFNSLVDQMAHIYFKELLPLSIGSNLETGESSHRPLDRH